MKNNILIFLALCPFILNSQNLEPTQSTFVVPAISQTPTYLSGDLPYFQQTKFVKGVHWDYTPRLGKVLGMSQQDINNFQYTGAPYHEAESTELNNNTLLHVKLKRWIRYDAQLQRDIYETLWTHCQGPDIVNARGIEYAPFLTINPNQTDKLQTIYNNPRKNVFGFQNIVGNKDTNNDCLLIDTSLKDSVILTEPWTADQFSSKSVSKSLDNLLIWWKLNLQLKKLSVNYEKFKIIQVVF